MRSILRTLPIRWQITVLHATVLALVLAAGGLALWNAQRTLQYDSVIAQQLTEARALIPEELNLKLEAGIYPMQKPDPALLKERYDKIVAVILPPNSDPAVARKKIALLNPKLADQVFPPGAALPARDEMERIVSKFVGELFPPDEDPMETRKKLMSLDPDLVTDLFPTPTVDQAALRKYLADLVQQVSAKDRGVVMFGLDGSVLARSSSGPVCQPPEFASTSVFAGKPDESFFAKLKLVHAFETVSPGQTSLLLPVIWQQDRPLALAQVCVSTDWIDAGLNQLAALLVVGWVLVVGLATLLGVTATRRVLQPLDQVVATTRRIAAGDLQQRVGLPPGNTEIAQLGAAFDAMVARLEEAFAAQRRFVADAAHELRTPLTALSASVELLLMGAADQDQATAQRLLRHLDGELSRVIRLTNDLLTLSRLDARPPIALRPTDLSAVLEAVAEHSRTLLRGQELIVDLAPALWVQADSDQLRQVVLNLLDNARKYTAPGGTIALRASSECSVLSSKFQPSPPSPLPPGEGCRDSGGKFQPSPPSPLPPGEGCRDSGGVRETQIAIAAACSKLPAATQNSKLKTQNWIVVEVEDSGVGIPADALAHLFERFYRVDGARTRASGGSGLGLAIVRAIVQAHGGQVGVRSTPGAGTCVTIQLPQPPASQTQSAGAQDQVALAVLPGAAE